jgi:DnaK suppressor protein
MESVVETLSHEQLALLKSMLERRLDTLAHAESPVESTAAGELPVSEVETSPLDRATVRLLNDMTREAAGHRAKEAQLLRQALARIADGSYGHCEECGLAIGASRLLARPEARLCIACQTRAERR